MRRQFLHAYCQGAIPLDVHHQEQDRKALDLLANCQHAYTRAPGHLRRQRNQALFVQLHVHDDTIQHADNAEPFATLTTPTLPERAHRRF